MIATSALAAIDAAAQTWTAASDEGPLSAAVVNALDGYDIRPTQVRTRPRARCHICHFPRAVTHDGLIRRHRGEGKQPCPGSGTRPRGHATPKATPTTQQLLVLHGIAHGWTDRRIARELGLSENTVKTHAKHLFNAIGANGRTHAVAIGFNTGLLLPATTTEPK
ncbi:response regulator transcription factor [Embleya sp. NPDC050154]|uniref:response regulator transcription factor n=1 Tax=Embleya sp. NPDC050154 TaxID=3363988 RepID=UPI0037B102F6